MSLSEKTKTTSRKFYNKWLYKVTLSLQGARIFNTYDLDKIMKFCDGHSELLNRSWEDISKNQLAVESIVILSNIFKQQDPKSYSKRIENNYMDIYTNDELFYRCFLDKLEHMIKHCYEPDEEAKELLKDDVKIIIADRYPHKKYKYRVYLLPHKFNKDNTAKSKYIDWLRSQSPRITCTNAVERWIMKTDWNWDRRYVLVEDKNTLMLLRLRNPEVVGSVYEFVLSDK